ncbi:hypothetical protein GPOL_c07810 [Gordonia polyisoprenivorans VH2]|uniref:ASCH domain-containing protein n=1 Tax=Gordonia polyisoprenivorans (strain DSM 44266 / VH2) TaxID=1112204 RepID=H6MXS8_GORPV|nr:hypothetical protein [Gordonia polyisoprenivorans]AFA71848.1 hypothetical protein GPOL_c07810 [Gordonia polyisoprenivorans VH2]MBE7194380.1 hypothetical protein [Gordonia polyisoprenivorans]OZC33720.1 hypothetical protein CJJ17_21150 [Gordonia polyisoprenivorans]QUD82033.1 hypothetical protein J8M97_20150 [Gordonia polyisoprenivorans]UZF57160.1 hypothetical protein LH935_03970 [Gordonia polyisoprenivorans]
MLIPARLMPRIVEGEVDLAFRRWSAPRLHPGSRFVSQGELIEITSVEQVTDSEISDADAHRAGFDTAEQARKALRRTDDPVFRIGLRHAGPDPRIALRNDAALSAADLADLRTRLDRLDSRAPHGPWTREVLTLIARRPGVVSTELAAEVGRPRPDFKLDVRKLKKLGLTHSLEVGYELSPRGEEFLRRESPSE